MRLVGTSTGTHTPSRTLQPRWSWLVIVAAPLVGCQATQPTAAPQPAPVQSAANPASPALQSPPADDARVAESDVGLSPPEASHRARKFYLQGVKLLYDPPRVEEAIREFQLALQEDNHFYQAHFKLGICYYHLGQYEREIFEYRKCLAVNPGYVPAQLNLGHAYLAQDMLEQAREAYRKVLDLDGTNAVALYNLGLVEFDLRDFDQSQKHLDKFLSGERSGEMSEMSERARQYLEEIRLKPREGS